MADIHFRRNDAVRRAPCTASFLAPAVYSCSNVDAKSSDHLASAIDTPKPIEKTYVWNREP